MSLQQGVFYLFAGIAIISAGMVILSKNPVRAVLCLVLTFFATAVTWLILEAEFLAMTLILVYVGAVMVLFLFVVMMLNIDVSMLKARFTRILPISICVAVLLCILLINSIGPYTFGTDNVMGTAYPKDYNSVKVIGMALYTKYLFHLEVVGILLLAAIVAAIKLSLRHEVRRRHQSIHQQVSTKRSDRIQLLDIAPEKQKVGE